jgi:hypothetical protein
MFRYRIPLIGPLLHRRAIRQWQRKSARGVPTVMR